MKFNYSALSTAQDCLQKYKYRYIDGIKEPGPESIDLHFGTAMHMGIEAILNGDLDYQDTFNLYWDSIREQPLSTGAFSWEALKEQSEVFLSRFVRLHAKKFGKGDLEITLDNGELFGTPDFIGEYEGVLSVVDFKTSRSAYIKEKISLNEQMKIYAYLYHKKTLAMPVQLVYTVFVKFPEPRIQVLKHQITAQDIEEAMLNVRKQIELIKVVDEKKAYTKNTNNCMKGSWKCPYYSMCHKEK